MPPAATRFRVPHASSFIDTLSVVSGTQRDTRQAGATSGGDIYAYAGSPSRRDPIRPSLRQTRALMPVKKEIVHSHEMPAFESGTATTARNVREERSGWCKIPEPRVLKEGGSSEVPVRETGAFPKRCNLEHGQSSGYSGTSFYLNLVKALTTKLEGRGSSNSTH